MLSVTYKLEDSDFEVFAEDGDVVMNDDNGTEIKVSVELVDDLIDALGRAKGDC